MFLATPPPDIQHLRALAMFLCIDCTRPPPDPILDIGHRLIGDRENMLIGRNVYATFVAHPHAFYLITSQIRDFLRECESPIPFHARPSKHQR